MKKKFVIIIVFSVLTVSILTLLGFRGFVSSIRSQRNCDWANIDNIELHAQIDIPKVRTSDCAYEKENNTKKTFFIIDATDMNSSQYIHANKLERIRSITELDTTKFLKLDTHTLTISELYTRQSTTDNESYYVLLDKQAGKLWVTINYKD